MDAGHVCKLWPCKRNWWRMLLEVSFICTCDILSRHDILNLLTFFSHYLEFVGEHLAVGGIVLFFQGVI